MKSLVRIVFIGAFLLAVLPKHAEAQSGPKATPEIVAKAAAAGVSVPPGVYQATWDSLKENYKTPQWFRDAKFGLFMHWGLYASRARERMV